MSKSSKLTNSLRFFIIVVIVVVITTDVQHVHGHLEVLFHPSYLNEVPPHQAFKFYNLVRGVLEGIEELIASVHNVLTDEMVIKRELYTLVSTIRTVYINVYAKFNVFTIEVYRRPESAVIIEVCGTYASRLRDNVFVAKIEDINETCLIRVYPNNPYLNKVILYEERRIMLDTIEVIVPDLSFELYLILFAFVLLIPLFLILKSVVYVLNYYYEDLFMGFVTSFFILAIFSFLLALYHPGLFIMFYYMVTEVLMMLFAGIELISIRRQLRVKKHASRDQKGERVALERKEWLPHDTIALYQEILKQRLPDPPRKMVYEEVCRVPKKFKEFLRRVGNELCDEMRLVGCGSWGCVYACGDYAIKIPHVLRDIVRSEPGEFPTIRESLVRRVMEEAEVVYNLDHDNILKLIDYSPNPPILVYKLADGNLDDYKDLDFKNVLLAVIQVCEALRYLHSRGLVHGDLKPSNILVAEGKVRVGDFSSLTSLLRTISKSSVGACTRGYCAPEQLFLDLKDDKRRIGYENRIDVYQLANVIVSIMGGIPLDGSEWSSEKVNERVSCVNVSELRDLLKDMLAREPWFRPNIEDVERKLIEIWKKYLRE